MSIVDKNYKILEDRYPEIYARMKGLAVTEYEIIPSKVKGHAPNLRSKKTGKLFYNELNPMAGAEQDILRRNLKVTEFNIFLGSGLLYQVFALYAKYKVIGGNHIIIEKDPQIFAAAMQSIDMRELLSRDNIFFIVGEELKGVFARVNNVLQKTDSKFYVKAINFIEQPVCFIEDKDYYLNCVRAIKEAIREVLMFFGNDPMDSMIGIENTFTNIEEIIENPGIQDLKDAFKGKPGIVVATGPSLDKNVELLRGLENRAVIVGADASLRVLGKRGLKPHMVCSLERTIPTSKLFENLEPSDFEDVYYSATPVIHPQSYANFKGKRIIVYRNFATFQWLDIKKGILDIGPSSGNMAFKILEYLGCDPIILIGQDLAFGEDGNTHAQGNTYGENEEVSRKDVSHVYQNVVYVEGNYVPQLKTTKIWNMFLNYYHKDVTNSKAKVINATEGGAKIFGTELMTFKDAMEKYIGDDIDVLKTIGEKLDIPAEEEKEQNRRQVLDKVNSGLDLCFRSIDNFKDSIRLCDIFLKEIWAPYKAAGQYDSGKEGEVIRGLDENGKIFRDTEFFNVLMHYVQSYFIRIMIDVNSVDCEDIPRPEQSHKKIVLVRQMYEVLIRLTDKMVTLLQSLKARMEADLDIKGE